MAKAWFDNQPPTMEMGILGGMPDMALTEEDKKRALIQALMQGGLGMAASSMMGNPMSHAMGSGLLGGVDAYGQGLQAPMNRFEMAKKQLEFQGNQIKNSKDFGDLQQQNEMQRLLNGVSNVTANPFQFPSQPSIDSGVISDTGRGPLSPDSPEMQQGAQQEQAALFNNPAFLSKLAANGMKGADISALGGRFDPQKREPGTTYQDPTTMEEKYYASLPQGMTQKNGVSSNMPGYLNAMQDRTLAEKVAEMTAELQRRKGIDPIDIKKSGDTALAEAEAKFKFNTEKYINPETGQASTRFVSESTGMPGAQPVQPQNGQINAAQELARLPDGPQKQALMMALQLDKSGDKSPFSVVVPGSRGAMPTELNPISQAATTAGINATIDQLKTGKANAQKAADAMLSLNQASEAVKAGTYQGRFADWKSSGAALMNVLPGLDKFVDQNALGNSEVAAKHLARGVLDSLNGSLGTGVSNADRDFIQKTVPQLTNNPQAFGRLVNYIQSMHAREIERHNNDAIMYHGVKGSSPTEIGRNYLVNMPENLASQRAAQMKIFKEGSPKARQMLLDQGFVQ